MKSNEINQNNVWYQIGKLISATMTDDELDIFLKKNNLYTTINASSNSSFKLGTFEKLINILDEKGINTSDIKILYLEWSNSKNSNIKGFDRYSFYWGYDVEKLNQKEFISFAEASKLWGLGESTLRSVVGTNRLVAEVDYRKSGKVWLITKKAMKKLYGEPKNKANEN